MGSRIGSDFAGARARLAMLSLAGLTVLAPLAPAAASAATVSKDAANLNFSAAAGEVNQTVVSLAGGAYTVDDSGAAITPGAGCSSVDSNTATCPAAGITRIVTVAGDRNDVILVSAATSSTLFGSEGNDTLVGNNADDILIGCAGDDTMIGGAGADTQVDALFCAGGGSNQFLGGAGNDMLQGGPDEDTFDAGAGQDELRAADGVVDSLNCGDNFDSGTADIDDLVNPDCEDIQLSGFVPDEEFSFEDFGFTECLPEDLAPEEFEFFEDEGFEECLGAGRQRCSSLRIRGRRASLHGGAVAIRLKLPKGAGGVCRAALKLDALVGKSRRAKARARRMKIGSEPFSLRPGQSKRFKVQLSRAGRGLVQRRGRLPVRVTAFSRGEGKAKKLDSALIKVSAGR